MKILWHSVAPWAPTGYGQQTGIFAPRIRDLGHDVALSAYYGHQGGEMRWEGMRVFPSYSANYGTDVVIQHALTHFGAEDAGGLAEASCQGMVILLGDAWTFEVPLLDQMAAAAWVPVDHLTLPDVTRRWFDTTGAVPVAMSRFGERLLNEAGLHPEYVPHGVDLGVFRPGDQAAARDAVGVPADAFVVGMVANNIGRDGNRKAFTEQIAAFAELRKRHPDAFLVLHTDVDQPVGVRLRAFCERMLPDGSYTWTDPYMYRKGISAAGVAQIYRSFDVLTNCSYGEGFGIPVVEAQACGVPVVVTGSTAMTELCGAGWKTGYERVWHESQGAWASVPRIGDIAGAYEEAYSGARSEDMRAAAWAFAQDYDADLITGTYWKNTLDRFAAGLERRLAGITARRALTGGRARERLREADGLWWISRGAGSDDWVATEDHENWLWPILDSILPEDGVFLDIGAHVGRWALRLSGRASQVIAVEANPSTYTTLLRHLAINNISNVLPVNVAAWDEPARLTLDNPDQREDAGGARTVWPTGNDGGTIRAERLDHYRPVVDAVTKAGRLDLVKIDVEGADLHVLRGLKGLLRDYHPALLIECHDIYGYYSRADLEQTLTDLGYGFEIAASVPSNWQPGEGVLDHSRDADYLVAKPG